MQCHPYEGHCLRAGWAEAEIQNNIMGESG